MTKPTKFTKKDRECMDSLIRAWESGHENLTDIGKDKLIEFLRKEQKVSFRK